MGFPIVVLIIAVVIGAYVYLAPETDTGDIDPYIVTNSDMIEKHLKRYKRSIGDDYAGYRGHIYRVFSYTLYKLRDKNLNKKEKEMIETALVYHDIGLWSDKELNYIEPSVDTMIESLPDRQYTKKQIRLMEEIIRYHHKITTYSNENDEKDIVNTVRECDLIDFSLGMVTNGVSRANIKKVMDKIPNDGFHYTLMTIGSRYHGFNFFKIFYELGQIFYL